MDIILLILSLGLGAQLLSVYFAIALIRYTEKRIIGVVFVVVVTLMSFRRMITLGRFFSHGSGSIDLSAEIVALFISLLLLYGIVLISRFLISASDAKDIAAFAEKRYRALFDQSPDGVLLMNMSGEIIDFNEVVNRQLGYTRAEFSKLQISDIDPVESQEEISARFARVLSVGADEFAVKHTTKQGDNRDVLVICKKIELAGQTFFHTIWRDITESNKAKSKMQQLLREQQIILDTLATGVAYARERKLIWTNPAFQQIFGYSAQECENFDAQRLYVHVDTYERIGQEGYTELAKGGSYSTDGLARRKNGSTFWLNLIGKAIDPQNPLDGSIWIFEDISERKETETKLKDKTRQLELLSHDLEQQVDEEIAVRMKNEQLLVQQSKLAAMGEMLGAIAHQWRQPLNTSPFACKISGRAL